MPTTMTTEGVRQRYPPVSETETTYSNTKKTEQQHPDHALMRGAWNQALRMGLFALYFAGTCTAYALVANRDS